MIRIIIADDHDIVRAGLKSFLEQEEDIEVAGEAGTGREAVDVCKQTECDLILLDLDMPESEGFETIKRIIALGKGIRVLILTMHDDEDYAIGAMKSGAGGFVLKGSLPQHLPDAIRKVAAGKLHVSRNLMEKITMRQLGDGGSPLSILSPRELEILPMLARGMTLKEISGKLNISLSTVASHKQKIMEKLAIKSRSDLVSFSMKHGLMKRKS